MLDPWAMIKFVAILFAVLLTLFSAILSTRFWGLGQQYQVYDHPALSKLPAVGVVVTNIDEAKRALEVQSELFFWLNIRPTKDGFFLVMNEKDTRGVLSFETLGSDKFKGDKPADYNLDFLRLYFPKHPLLLDVLRQFPNQIFILNVVDSVLDVDRNLIKFIDDYKLDQRVIVQSSAHVVLGSIKKDRPTWLFGSSQSDWVRALSFHSAFVLPALSFKGDIYVSPMSLSGRAITNNDIVMEMHRRFKKYVAGPLMNSEEVLAAQDLHPDALLFGNLELLSQHAATKQSQ